VVQRFTTVAPPCANATAASRCISAAAWRYVRTPQNDHDVSVVFVRTAGTARSRDSWQNAKIIAPILWQAVGTVTYSARGPARLIKYKPAHRITLLLARRAFHYEIVSAAVREA